MVCLTGETGCDSGVFGFHNEGEDCGSNGQETVFQTLRDTITGIVRIRTMRRFAAFYLKNDGYAYMSFLTTGFTATEIIGRTVVIHLKPDDFHSQPSGNSGEKNSLRRYKSVIGM